MTLDSVNLIAFIYIRFKITTSMKNFLLILLYVLTANIVCGQSQIIIPLIDGKMCYSKITKVDSTGKDELYKRAKIWLVESYKSAKSIIQLDDKENGQIITKSIIYSWMSGGLITVYCTTKLDFKDNRSKIEIASFIVNDGNTNIPLDEWDTNKRRLNGCLTSVDAEAKKIISSYEISIVKPTTKDW